VKYKLKARAISRTAMLLFIALTATILAGYMYLSRVSSIMVYTPPTIQPLLEVAIEEYERVNPNVRVQFIAGATGALLARVELTGTGDILITADHEYMVKAIEKGLVYNDTVRVLSYAIIALIVPKGNPAGVKSLDDLVVKNVRIGIADPKTAPFGRMAVELLVKNGIYDKVKEKLVVYSDVGQVARQVSLGLVDVALLPHVIHYVYEKDTDIVWLDASELPRVSCQMVAVLRTTKDYEEAVRFLDFLAEFTKSSEYAARRGYVGRLEDLPKLTPYEPSMLEFEHICLVGGS